MRWILATITITMLLTPPCQASTRKLLAEAEWYTNYHDLGGLLIERVRCVHASNDTAVDYIDVVDEWIQLTLTFTEQGWFGDTLCAAALEDSVSIIRLILSSGTGPRADQISDVEIIGEGIG